MTDRTFKTEVTYNNNCNYQQSKYTQDIDVPLSQIELDITFTNVSQPTQSNLYFNDTIKISVFAHINEEAIKWGNVVFYYVDTDDMSTTKQKINHTPIAIDKTGKASVNFIPHNSGTIYAKYYGEPYHKTENEYVSNNFVLHTRPTHIQFEEYSPYLVNPSETVTMNVEVTDAHTEELIDYGLVTFMNYHEYTENRVEKIIGNPKYLIDGKASIKYSPIQLGTNELFHNIELIRASYNYNNEEYGVNWKYYAMHDDFTAIAIRRENQININIPQIKKSENNYQALTVTDEGSFVAYETDPLVCQCEITISEKKVVTDAIVNFVVEGISKTYNSNNVTETEIIKTYPAHYRHTNSRDYFECLIEHLPQGMYTIYATIENPTTKIDGQEYTLPVIDNNLETPNVPITNHELLVKDGFYLQSNTSENFYIKIEPQESSLELTLTNSKPLVTNKTINKDDIQLEITTSDSTDINIFNGKTCYFYIPNLNTRVQGTITSSNNKLYAKPTSNISITNIGNYDMYAYIEGGIYTYTNNGTTITRQIPTIYSNTIDIKIRDQINITLKLQTMQEAYPNNIKYIVEGQNLSDDPIQIDIYIDNVKTNLTHTLSKLIKNATGTIPLQIPGSHTIKAIVNDANYTNIQTQQTFTVTKGKMDITLTNTQPIPTSTTADLIFDIEHKNRSELTNIENLTFAITPTIQNATPDTFTQTLTKLNNKLYELKATGCLYIAGEWQVNISCANNDYYDDPNTTINFATENEDPICVNVSKTTSTFINQVAYGQNTEYVTKIIDGQPITTEVTTYNALPCKVLIISKLKKDENNYLTFVHITDSNGNYTITKPQTMSDTEWQTYKTLEYQIVPQHAILNTFKGLSNANQAVSTFNSTFTNHQCSNADIQELYTNAKTYNFTTLFVGYNSATDTINLYEEEENGIGSN